MNELEPVGWLDIQFIEDSRGQLLVIESKEIPFSPARFFTTSVKGKNRERGGHLHKDCWQVLFCISGEIEVLVVTKDSTEAYSLTEGGSALLVPAGHWCKQIFRNANSILGALASHTYDAEDYVYEIP